MFKQGSYKIAENVALTENVFKMVLEGDTSFITKAGQFINILVPEKFLRRPISVCDFNENSITIIYKVVGEGTEILSKMPKGEMLDCLTGLGNGYNISKSKTPLVIGGGVGVPPLYYLTKCLLADGQRPTVILGFNTKSEIFFEKKFKALGVDVIVATADGSYGVTGFVTDAMKGLYYDYFYTCGPMPMFRAIEGIAKTSGQYSFEERMGCGFGACMGCSCKTKSGFKRICKDGPVFEREDIIW